MNFMLCQFPRLLYAVIASVLLTTDWLGAAPAGEPPEVSPDTELIDYALAHGPCSESDHSCTAAAEASLINLSARLDMEIGRIELLRKYWVTWSNGSLGCPQPGWLYTQAVVDGLFIELRVCETSYRYHAGRAGKPFLCVQPQPADDGTQHG